MSESISREFYNKLCGVKHTKFGKVPNHPEMYSFFNVVAGLNGSKINNNYAIPYDEFLDIMRGIFK